jgi:hypothetical protein
LKTRPGNPGHYFIEMTGIGSDVKVLDPTGATSFGDYDAGVRAGGAANPCKSVK